MSRIGRSPIFLDDKVQVQVSAANEVTVKGVKSTIVIKMNPAVTASVEDRKVTLKRVDSDSRGSAFHGMYRALIQNAVTGVSRGWTKELELNGVGYRASVAGKKLELSLGYSHPIQFDIPDGIEIKVDKQTRISVTGASRELVGQVAAKIRGFRPPEPYLGKGVKYVEEKIRRKAGKSAAK